MGRSALAAAVAILLAALTVSAHAETPGYELVVEGSPIDAGNVTPNTGTHLFSPHSTVTLTAEPQAGFRFAYWLGDVSDPGSQRTTITLNEPKVVVAVFHPLTDERIDDDILPSGGGGGDGGMLLSAASDLSSPGWSPVGGARAETHAGPPIAPGVATPEPTTIALLALGTLALGRRRR